MRYLALALLGLVLLAPGIGHLPLTDRDEARFVQASRQMLETGNLVDIRFQDEPRYNKPVGIYWLQATSAAASRLATGDGPLWSFLLASGLPVHNVSSLPFGLAFRRLFMGPSSLLLSCAAATV